MVGVARSQEPSGSGCVGDGRMVLPFLSGSSLLAKGQWGERTWPWGLP